MRSILSKLSKILASLKSFLLSGDTKGIISRKNAPLI